MDCPYSYTIVLSKREFVTNARIQKMIYVKTPCHKNIRYAMIMIAVVVKVIKVSRA